MGRTTNPEAAVAPVNSPSADRAAARRLTPSSRTVATISVVVAFVAATAATTPVFAEEPAEAADTNATDGDDVSPEPTSPESPSPEPPIEPAPELSAPDAAPEPSNADVEPVAPFVLPPPAPAPKPLALPPPAGAAPIVLDSSTAPADSDDAEADLQLYGGIVVTGVGAALFVLAGMAVGRIDDIQSDNGFVAYRQGLTPDRHACEEANNGVEIDGAASPERVVRLCAEASRWEVTNYVAMPGGVAMVAMGLYLILTSDTARGEAPVALIPQLGPQQAGLTLAGRF